MDTINVRGWTQPVSRLMMGSDFFRLDNYGEVAALLDEFAAHGGNCIDTAHIYCGGQSEQVIGRYLEECGARDRWVILTKGAHHGPDGEPRVTREHISRELETSLERLRTDHVALYALHRDDPATPVGAILEWLNEHVEAGRIGAFGGSNWTWRRLAEANEYAERHGLAGFSFSSPNLSLAKANEPFWRGCVSADAETLAWHERTGLPLFSWSSQARGFFTGRYTPEVRDNADLVRVFYSEANWERMRRARLLADEFGVPVVQIALAYVLNQPFPTCALVAPRNSEELASSVAGSRIRLTPGQVRWLDLAAETPDLPSAPAI